MSDTLTGPQDVAVSPAVEAVPAAAVPMTPAAAPVPVAKPDKPAPKSPKPKSTAKKTRSVELTLTVTGTAEGEWQADLTHGTSRVVTGLVIPASAVVKAARELHEDIATGIDAVIEAARDKHRSRMEELESELARVKAQLADLAS